MIRSLAYFPSQCAANSGPVMQAILDSARMAGIITKADCRDCDAAVIWSVLWQGRMANNRVVYEHYRTRSKPVIIAEIGCLSRGHTWKIAVDNITSEGYYGHDQNLDPDRPKKLNIALADCRPHDRILIALQHRRSQQVTDIRDMPTWLLEKIKEIRKYSDRPIVVRPHPRDSVIPVTLPSDITISKPRLLAGSYDSFDWHNDYHAVINHNSGPGILAALAGVRPVVHPTSLASPVAVSMQDIEKSYDIDREQWLIQIAHTEYTVDEIGQGSWLKRLAGRLC